MEIVQVVAGLTGIVLVAMSMLMHRFAGQRPRAGAARTPVARRAGYSSNAYT